MNKQAFIFLSFTIFLQVSTSSAAILNYNNQTDTILANFDVNQGEKIINIENNSDIIISNDSKFENQVIDDLSSKIGGLINIDSSNVAFEDNISFSNNIVKAEDTFDYYYSDNTNVRGGIININNNSNVAFGNNLKFDNNKISTLYNYTGNDFSMGHSEVYGGIITTLNYGNNTIKFGDNISFSHNQILAEHYTSEQYSMGSAMVYGGLIWNGVNMKFGNNIHFDNNDIKSIASSSYNANMQGGIINSQGDIEFGDNITFKNNTVGAIMNSSNNTKIGDLYASDNNVTAGGGISGGVFSFGGSGVSGKIVNFLGNVNIVNNNSSSINGNVYGGAIYLHAYGYVNFSPTEVGNSILIENNKTYSASGNGKLSSIYFSEFGSAATSYVNFDMIAGTWANLRDPMASAGVNAVVNKTGAGSLYLWGDNSEYSGDLNIKDGSFYAMFEDKHDAINDPLGQRLNFNLSNATTTFENGSLFRPKVTTNGKIADLDMNSVSVNGNVDLVPYDISRFDVGSYSYSKDYSAFGSWESALAKVDTNSAGTVELEIKRDLKGYDNLTAFADIYRKRGDLSLNEREELDNLYYTGLVNDDFKDKLDVLDGGDLVNSEQIHKSSIRQFNRQISSRIQNKDCPECGINDGYSDEHFWFNIGQNWMKKDTNSKSLGYTYNPTSFAFGYDYDFIPKELNLGIAASYAFGESKTKVTGLSSENDINEYLISLYGKYKPSKAYVSGSIGGGVMTNDTEIASSGVNSNADFNTYVLFANSEFGYGFGDENTYGLLEPFVGLEYTHIDNEAYTEKGTGARHFDRMNWDTLELPIGMRFTKSFKYEDYIITPAVEIAYARNIGETGSNTRAYFVSNAGTSWKVNGTAEGRDSIRSNFNLKINNLSTPFAFNLGYARDTRTDYKDDQFYLTVRYNF
ncbi:MAG: autotransporter domain-containing protein [Alphaproteobacteria bacterium]